MKEFDLNVEKVLEHWTIAHALREIIANALDESILTNTDEPQIFKDHDNKWHIRDFGRGLKYEHLTQNENSEKTEHPDKVIGKFGVGLKDAMATFDRRNIGVIIQSKYSDITIEKLTKGNFDDLVTLHAIVKNPTYPNMVGTDFILTNVKEDDIKKAKNFFLQYSGEKIIETTKYGELIENSTGLSKIYVNGLSVAEEENFLFSYNITSTTKQLRKSLNRERTNVGRTAYSDRIKSILLECTSQRAAETLVDDLQKVQTGNVHEELLWIDIQLHACKILSSIRNVIFLTANDLINGGKYVKYAEQDGLQIITIPDSLAGKLVTAKDLDGNSFRDIDLYAREWNEKFEFDIIPENQLTKKEREVFNYKDTIVNWYPNSLKGIKDIVISNTMSPNNYTGTDALGIWEPSTKRIIIKRTQLKDVHSFASTLLHELIHAHTGTDDNTIEFENELTDMLGRLSTFIIKNDSHSNSNSLLGKLFKK
ncbi:ATP-binding protein [Allobacillus sp. SKP2-8]|uniref:ATP-binding protein n=1 Tax=unclassified Allobacillus TaxID=2628859 RepID=UPI001183673B|nr:ATP-binding protein [Allobacillus sp. SKP2-8]TSJ67363.1 ATP-binding protein [Allobacillus sp. SKP2-8]